MSYSQVTSEEVLYQAPITSQLFKKIRDDYDYIKSVLSDGATAPTGVYTSDLETTGAAEIESTLYPNGGHVKGVAQTFNLQSDTQFKKFAASLGYAQTTLGNNFADRHADGTDWNAITMAIVMGKTNNWIEMGGF